MGVPLPVVCQPYYNLLNRMPEVEILPACDYYGIGVVPYSPLARGVLTGKYAPGGAPPDGLARGAQGPADAWKRNFARNRSPSRRRSRRTPRRPAARRRSSRSPGCGPIAIVTSVIAGPRTLEQWNDYLAAIGTSWSDEDEALVDSLVTPGHPSTPGYNDPQYPFYGVRAAKRLGARNGRARTARTTTAPAAGTLLLVGDAVQHVAGWHVLRRRLDVARLVVEEEIRLELAQEIALGEAAEEQRLVDLDVPVHQRADRALVRRARCAR